MTAPIATQFFSLARLGGGIVVGGGLTNFSYSPLLIQSLEGLLYSFNPVSGHFTNPSAALPVPTEPVWVIEPWNTSVLIVQGGFRLNSSAGWDAGSFYTMATPTAHLLNKTSKAPAGFYPDFYGVTSESGGMVYLGGELPSTSRAMIVALPVP